MRTISLVFSAILVMATIAANVAAKPPTVVYRTGIFPTDVQNVQAAINQGGTVLLKATDSVGHPLAFNFGPPAAKGGVDIGIDVSITGERAGANRTTISGGVTPFLILGGKNSIVGITFDGPSFKAIKIRRSNGTSIIDNEIKNVVPFDNGFSVSDGIDVFPSLGRPATDISANLVISGNTFGDLTGNFSIAIQVDSVAANVTISNNIFQLGQLASDLGFLNSAAIACVRCHSTVAISGNMITVGPGIVFSGITVFGGADARYHVFDNTVFNSPGSFADGIDVFGQTDDPGPIVSAVVENNSVTVHNEFFAGIAAVGAVSSSTFQRNTVIGDAGAAIVASQFFPNGDIVSFNRFLNNDVASVNASVASIFLDSNTVNNVVRGQCVSTVDLGIGNDISCPNLHSTVNSSAFTLRQQMLQRALQAQSAVHAQSSSLDRP